MAQTTFNLAVEKIDTPLTDGSPSAEKTSSGNSKTGAGNQGFLTQDGAISKDVIGVVSSPIVSGAFIFAGIILLLALVAKLKKNKHSNFKDSLTRKHYTTRILGFAAFLTLAAGLGGTVSRFMGVEAAETDLNGVITSGVVNASLVEVGEDYKLYCGTDTITIKSATESGYLLYAKNDNSGNLVSQTASVANISSIEDWSTLANGTWGFKTDKEVYAEITDLGQYKPLHLGDGVIAANYEATPAGEQVKVDYCAKVAKDAADAEYQSKITYGVVALDGSNIAFVDGIDYDSSADYDVDGLSNREENRYGTNVSIDDTDMDGLSDLAELKTYGTDPLSEDTDNDGISDNSEIALELNPLKTDSKGDGIQDGDRTLSYTITDEDTGVSIALTGKGDLPMSQIVVNDDVTDIEDSALNLYSLSTGANVTSATITIPYDVDGLEEEVGSTIVEDELVIAKYDSEGDALSTITSTLDTAANTISATMSDLNAQYIIADKDTEATSETIVEDVYGSITNDDETDDEILNDSYGGILKKIVAQVTKKVQKTKTAQATDCLTNSTGCDSGFRGNKNGIAFANYSAKDHGAVCAGMAAFAKLYHEGRITNGNYAYNEGYALASDEKTVLTKKFTYSLNLSGNLYNYTSSGISSRDNIKSQGLQSIANSNAQITGKNGIIAALIDARTAYGDITSTYIKTYQTLGAATTIVPILVGEPTNISVINTSDYLNKIKNAFSNGRSLYGFYYVNLAGVGAPFIGAHGINLEKVVYKSKNAKTGISSYTLSFYDNNYPGEDYTATMKCGQLVGCYALPSKGDDFSWLGTRISIADTSDITNIFNGSRDAINYPSSYYTIK